MAKTESKFIHPISQKEGVWEQELGVTKREYFAAKAMQGLFAGGFNIHEDASGFAVRIADQLIESLKTKP